MLSQSSQSFSLSVANFARSFRQSQCSQFSQCSQCSPCCSPFAMCCSAAPLSLPRSANHKVRKRAAKHLRIEVRSSSFSSFSSFSSILLPSCTPSVLSGSFVATVRRQILVGPTDRRSPIVSARLHGRRSLAVSRLDGVSNRRVTRRLHVLCKACHGTYSHKCTIGRGVMVDHPGPRPKGPQPLTPTCLCQVDDLSL